jgi:3-mercaptopyruvate sulfurtransferase SseA
VATKLRQYGFTRIRPLLGGLDAWIDAGLPVDGADADEDGRAGGSWGADEASGVNQAGGAGEASGADEASGAGEVRSAAGGAGTGEPRFTPP